MPILEAEFEGVSYQAWLDPAKGWQIRPGVDPGRKILVMALGSVQRQSWEGWQDYVDNCAQAVQGKVIDYGKEPGGSNSKRIY